MQGVTCASVSSDLVIFASVKAVCRCFLPKVDELIRKPVLLAGTALRGSMDGRDHTVLRARQRYPSPSFPLCGDPLQVVSRRTHPTLRAVFPDRSICSLWGWENQVNWDRSLAFLHSRASSLLAPMACRASRSKGQLRILNFTLFLCCQIKIKSRL